MLTNPTFLAQVRFFSRNCLRCALNEAVVKKQDYYKNISDAQKEENTKPDGWDQAKPFESIPGPKPLPILGNTFRFFPKIGEFYGADIITISTKLMNTYGDIVAVRNLHGGFKHLIFLYSPDYIEQLFRNEHIWPMRLGSAGFDYYKRNIRNDVFDGVYGVLVSQGEEWFKIRTTINPILMQPRSIELYVDKIDAIASELVDNIKYFAKQNPQGEMPENFNNELNKYSLESVGVVALDARLGCLDRNLKPNSEEQIYINHILELFELFAKVEVLPNVHRAFRTKLWKRYVEVLDHVTFAVLKYVERAKIKDQTGKDESELSIIQRLVKIDKKIAIATAIDMLQAGVDTTSKILSAALYYLAKNPEVQKKFRKELTELLPHKDSPITKEVLRNAHYAKAIIRETTRLAPVVGGTARNVQKDLVIGGYQIPKGTDVINGDLIIARSEKYFARSKEFIPERWLRNTTDELSQKNAHPFASLPFGFGQRSCVGKRIALMELEMAIIKIIRNFELSWPHEDAVFKMTIIHGLASPLKLHVKEIEA